MSTSDDNFPRLSLDERDRRWDAARALMDKEGVKALLVFSDRDGAGSPLWAVDHWLTNDQVGTYVLFPRDGVPIVHVWSPNPMLDHLQSADRGEPVWLAPDQFRFGRGGARIVKTINEFGLSTAAIGVVGIEAMPPYGEGIVPGLTYQTILEGLPKVTFKPVGKAYGALLGDLSDEEFAMLRKSAAVGETMCEAAIEAAHFGATDADVLAALTAAGIRGGVWAWWTPLAAGDQDMTWGAPGWIYRAGGPRKIRSGDVLTFEIMPYYGHYESQQQLAIGVGDIHPDLERAAKTARESYEAGLKALRDGAATFGELDAAMTSVIIDAGGWNATPNVHTMPHAGVGARGPRESQDWTGAYPALSEWTLNDTGHPELELGPGMAYSLQPNCVFGRRRVHLGGTVITTSAGVEELSHLSTNLVHVDR